MITSGGVGEDAIFSAGPQASIGLLSNSGHIDGAVDLLGGSGTLDNLGWISGNVALAGGDILMNQGQVYGDVTLASRDALTNTGAINGDVTLGASDTFHAGSGQVTGTITASSGDLLDFSGSFGHATIDNFAAGAGPTHELDPNCPGRVQQLRGALNRQGADVKIGPAARNSFSRMLGSWFGIAGSRRIRGWQGAHPV